MALFPCAELLLRPVATAQIQSVRARRLRPRSSHLHVGCDARSPPETRTIINNKEGSQTWPLRRTFLATGAAVLALSLDPQAGGRAYAQNLLAESLVRSALKTYATDSGLGGTPSASERVAAQQEAEKIVSLASGVRYKDVVGGQGDPLGTGDVVVIHVKGMTRSGGVFVDTRTTGQPLTFTYGILPDGVCEGLEDGTRSMTPGGRRILDIPAELAYGPALGPIRMDVEMLNCTRLDESGALTCCTTKNLPCDPSNPNVVTLFRETSNDVSSDGESGLPANTAFTELNSSLTTLPSDMMSSLH